MRGWITDPAGPAGLRLAEDLPEPEPRPDQYVIEVRAYAVNPGEAILIERRPDGWRPGQDVTGVVVSPAADGSGPAAGTRVVARLDWEGWAERAAVTPHLAAVLDERVRFEAAATIGVAGLTALRSLKLGGSVLGQDVLVTGATGGVGQFAVQLAKLSGARVTALVSDSPGRAELARELGADVVVTSLDDDALGPFSLVLDGVGGPTVLGALKHCRPGATIAMYSSRGGETTLTLSDFMAAGAGNVHVVGFVSETPEERKGEDVGLVAGLMAEGRLVPRIGWSADWTRTPEAFAALADRAITGKVVLTRG